MREVLGRLAPSLTRGELRDANCILPQGVPFVAFLPRNGGLAPKPFGDGKRTGASPAPASGNGSDRSWVLIRVRVIHLQLLLAGLTLTSAPVPASPVQSAPVTEAPAHRPLARSGILDDLPIEKVVLLPNEVKANSDQFRQIDELFTQELD